MTPTSVRLRRYALGAGACTLVSLRYGSKPPRHVLVDFGASQRNEPSPLTPHDVATNVAAEIGGRLDGLVITRRHRAHVGGFALRASAAALQTLRPHVILRPWPEQRTGGAVLGAEAEHAGSRLAVAQREEIVRLGEACEPSPRALEQLAALGAPARPSALAKRLPGVTLTLREAKAIEPSVHHTSFAGLPFPSAHGPMPPRMRWIRRQMDASRGQQMVHTVRLIEARVRAAEEIFILQIGRVRLAFPEPHHAFEPGQRWIDREIELVP